MVQLYDNVLIVNNVHLCELMLWRKMYKKFFFPSFNLQFDLSIVFELLDFLQLPSLFLLKLSIMVEVEIQQQHYHQIANDKKN